jgi:hypothetical protein
MSDLRQKAVIIPLNMPDEPLSSWSVNVESLPTAGFAVLSSLC